MDYDFSTKPTSKGDHFLDLEAIRAAGPVTRNDLMCGWMVVNYVDVRNCLSDTKNFTSEETPLGATFGPEAMLVQDGPMHNVARNVWSKHVSPKALESKRGDLTRLADATITALKARLRSGQDVDLVKIFEDFIADSVIHVLGVTSERRGDFQRWNRTLSDFSQMNYSEEHPKAVARKFAKTEIYAMLADEVQRRRTAIAAGEPVDEGLVSLMTAAEGANGVTAQMVLDNLLNLLIGALDTTVKWLGNTVVILSRNPSELAKVLADKSLFPKMMDEVLRLESVVQLLVRKAKSDEAIIAGTVIPRGDLVYLFPGAANRDPGAFNDPTKFDVDRKAKPQLGFGYGLHVCLGMNLARLEADVFLPRLFEEIPDFKINEIDYGDNWLLWGPRVLTISATR